MKIEQIQQLVREGFEGWGELGAVTVKQYGDLLQFNYAPKACQTWNEFECLCRGLIIEVGTGDVIARPFDKFFNYGEGGRYPSNNNIVEVFEKVDGSLGIIYNYRNEWHVATRGSLVSPQAQWATEWMNSYCNTKALDPDYTYLVEIVYPDNRIVVNYGNMQGLVLLAMRNRLTGEYGTYSKLADMSFKSNLYTILSYGRDLSNPEDIQGFVNGYANFEGCIAVFEDGTRWKFKSDEYMRIHRLVSEYSFKAVAEAHRDGNAYRMKDNAPPWLAEKIQSDISEISMVTGNAIRELSDLFENAPQGTRKEFALYASQFPRWQHILFAMLDGKSYRHTLYKILFDL